MSLKLHNLKPTPNSRPEKHRKGRGHAAGKGKQAGKGQSGQNKRKGHRLGFEGGQTPWFRRIGKRGFKNVNHVEYQVVNISSLEERYSNNETVTLESLFERNLIRRSVELRPVKVLAKGKLTKKLTLQVHSVSQAAREAVEKAGGKVEEL